MSGIWVVYGTTRFQIPPTYKNGSWGSAKRAAAKHFGVNHREFALTGPRGKLSESSTVAASRFPRGTKIKLTRKPSSAFENAAPPRPMPTSATAPQQPVVAPATATAPPKATTRSSPSRQSQRPRNEGVKVALAVGGHDGRLEVRCQSTTTLLDILKQAEREHEVILTTRRSIPGRSDVGRKGAIKIEYNRAGDLRPVMTYGPRRFNRESMDSTTLQSINAEGSVLFRVEFVYVADPFTEEEQARFRSTMSGMASDSKEQELKMDVDEEDDQELTRNPRVVVLPTSSFDTSRYELPDEFYDLDVNDLEAVKKSIRRALPAFRAANPDRGSKLSTDYRRTILRIRLPSERAFLEGTFRSSERIGDVRNFVRESIVEDVEFQLMIGPPPQKLDDDSATLVSLGLTNRVIVNLKCKEDIHLTEELRQNAVVLENPHPAVEEQTVNQNDQPLPTEDVVMTE